MFNKIIYFIYNIVLKKREEIILFGDNYFSVYL